MTSTPDCVSLRPDTLSTTSADISLPSSFTFGFLANPFLDFSSYQHGMPTSSFVRDAEYSFAHGSIHSNADVFLQPISALAASSPHALFSFPVASSSTLPRFYSKALVDPQESSPKTPICSNKSSPPLLFSESTNKLLDGIPFTLSSSPSQVARTDLTSLLDCGSSPVVRRSQGDITPLFGRGGEVIIASQEQNRHEVKHAGEAKILEPNLELPSTTKRNTPFFQRLCRSHCKEHLPSPSSSHPDAKLPPPLASPFKLQTVPSQSVIGENSRSIIASDAPETPVREPLANREPSQSSFVPNRKLYLGLDFSPLSELSPFSPASSQSPLPFNLRTIFEEEDRKHHMNTRSRVRVRVGIESVSTPRSIAKSQTLVMSKPLRRKRKRVFLDEKAEESRSIDNDSEDENCPPMKRNKISNSETRPLTRVASSLRSTRQAGPITYLSQIKKSSISTIRASPQEPSVVSLAVEEAGRPSSSITSLTSTSRCRRTFPSKIPINTAFPLFYRQFPVSSYFYPNEDSDVSILATTKTKPAPVAHIYDVHDPYNLYTPRFTRGIGKNKLGMCPICFEPFERGGADHSEWLAMKFSAYKW
ncbi:hypothetical protein K439DRAFT_1635327 [Ramaria rubella]|nr:hypothetical protein K439DRAFT_1635327 [Ramaria rubella]